MKFYIYKFTMPDKKCYIGQTSNIKKRWYPAKYHGKVAAAISTFGWDSIKKEVLEVVTSIDLANEREHYFVEKFRANDPNFGYNVLAGGDNGFAKKICNKLSEAAKRRWADKRQREAQSRRMSGRCGWTWNPAWKGLEI